MHSLKILPLSPPSPRCPVIVVRHIRLWFLSAPAALACPSASHPPPSFRPALSRPPQPPHPALSRCHRSPRTLRAVIVVLVLWLVRETFSDLLLG